MGMFYCFRVCVFFSFLIQPSHTLSLLSVCLHLHAKYEVLVIHSSHNLYSSLLQWHSGMSAQPVAWCKRVFAEPTLVSLSVTLPLKKSR